MTIKMNLINQVETSDKSEIKESHPKRIYAT